MKIAVWVANVTSASGGVYDYTLFAIRRLLRLKSVEELVLVATDEQKGLCEAFAADGRVSVEAVDDLMTGMPNAARKAASLLDDIGELVFARGAKTAKYERLSRKLNPLGRRIDGLGCDALFVTAAISPAYGMKTPVAVTMHDVQELHFPEFFTPSQRIIRTIKHTQALRLSARVIVSFEHVKRDLAKYFAPYADKVAVCPIALEDWAAGKAPAGDPAPLKRRLELPDRFLLYPAQTWPHKNHQRLFEALARLKEKGLLAPLVCTGHRNDHYKTLQESLKALGLEGQVRFLDYVTAEELGALYHLARLVVVPSLYEAGSGPVYEAINQGVPVICSNVTSLPDAIGDRELTFDPTSVDQMVSLIERYFVDDDANERCRRHAVRQRERLLARDDLRAFEDAFQGLASSR